MPKFMVSATVAVEAENAREAARMTAGLLRRTPTSTYRVEEDGAEGGYVHHVHFESKN